MRSFKAPKPPPKEQQRAAKTRAPAGNKNSTTRDAPAVHTVHAEEIAEELAENTATLCSCCESMALSHAQKALVAASKPFCQTSPPRAAQGPATYQGGVALKDRLSVGATQNQSQMAPEAIDAAFQRGRLLRVLLLDHGG